MSSSSSTAEGMYGLTVNQQDWFHAFGWVMIAFFTLSGGGVKYDHSFTQTSGSDAKKRCCTWEIHLYYWLYFLTNGLVAAAFIMYWRNRIDKSDFDVTLSLIAAYLGLDKIKAVLHNFGQKYVVLVMQVMLVGVAITLLVFFALSGYAIPIGFFSPVVAFQAVLVWAHWDHAMGGNNMCARRISPRRARGGGGGGNPYGGPVQMSS